LSATSGLERRGQIQKLLGDTLTLDAQSRSQGRLIKVYLDKKWSD